jgi:shikimate dehydrogenase
MRVLGIEGLSVTMPHKAAVAAAVDRTTPVADRLGVCNCVYIDRDRGDVVGASTDGDGFVRSLERDSGVTLAGAGIAVVGTGGAARSIVEAAGRCQAAEIVVVSRSAARAAGAAELAPMARAGTVADLAGMDVVVNATPVGMAGGPDPGGVPFGPAAISDRHVVVDIVYEPRQTPLLIAAAERGAKAVNGVGMLLHQAALAFEHWTGHQAPIDAMRLAAFGSEPSTPS